MLILLGAVIATGIAATLLVTGWRNSKRRRLSRARREDDYADRKSQWGDYLQRSRPRRTRRLTDQSGGKSE